MDLERHLELLEQQQAAPEVVKKAREGNETEQIAEVCGEVEATLRTECQSRSMDKHDGIACLFLVVNRLADPDREPVGGGDRG